MSILTKLFQHNTWANLKLLDFCEGLDEEQLGASAIGGYGSIRDTLFHIVYSEMDSVNLATEKLPAQPLPNDRFPEFGELRKGVRWAGDEWLQIAKEAQADTIIRVMRPDEPVYEYPLSSFIAQFINHSTEHRTQISTIITQLGIEPPSTSGWTYMREIGEFREL